MRDFMPHVTQLSQMRRGAPQAASVTEATWKTSKARREAAATCVQRKRRGGRGGDSWARGCCGSGRPGRRRNRTHPHQARMTNAKRVNARI